MGNKVLIDGPTAGVARQAYALKQIHLTPIKVNFPFNACTRVVRKELESNKVDDKWTQSSWAKRLENKAKRTSMNDFDRFKLRKAKSQKQDHQCGAQRKEEGPQKGWKAVKKNLEAEKR